MWLFMKSERFYPEMETPSRRDARCCLTFIPASHNIASNRQMCKDQLTMFSFRGAERKRRTRKCEVKNGGFASRVVPNGVDATTAEWEGGAIRFIHAGLGICFCALREKKKMFYYHRLVMLFTPRCSAFLHSNLNKITGIKTALKVLYNEINFTGWEGFYLSCDSGFYDGTLLQYNFPFCPFWSLILNKGPVQTKLIYYACKGMSEDCIHVLFRCSRLQNQYKTALFVSQPHLGVSKQILCE